MALITCEDLTLSYENTKAVSGLSFTVNKGDYLCIVGENGSGKSTLIKALLGLKKPAAGSITYGDGLKQNEIGYLAQQTGVQKDFPASVWEVVLSGCLNQRKLFAPIYTKAQKEMALENLERLGVADLRGRCYRELSGGQQQRVLLARALCATKKLLLLDEPIAGLDPVATLEMYKLICDIHQTYQITVIMVSHDIKCSVEHADHVLHMNKTPLFFGTAHEYMHSEVGQRFLGGDCCHG